MTSENSQRREVDQFILVEIDSVPHLEALLLLWNSRPKQWSLEEMAHALYVPADGAKGILQDLKQRGLIASESDRYFVDPASAQCSLLLEVDRAYRRELVRISRMIHSKASPAVREFARAFRFKKD
jgi:DNA-binding IclR family transcriptional regulator